MSPFLGLHAGVQTRSCSNYGANKGERKWKNYSKRDLKRRISLLMAGSSLPSWQEMKKRKVVWGGKGGVRKDRGSCFPRRVFLAQGASKLSFTSRRLFLKFVIRPCSPIFFTVNSIFEITCFVFT